MAAFGFWLVAISLVALIGYNVVTYVQATGTVKERLAACGSGSLTIFVNIWGGIISFLVVMLDTLAGSTTDPVFIKASDALNGVIPPQYHPIFPVATAALAIWARRRTMGKA